MAPLTNTKVLVIGGSSGIGFGVAKAALAEGATVVIASSSQDRVRAAAARLGHSDKLVADQVDVTSEGSVKGLFERVGQLDHLVITTGRAGVFGQQSFLETDLKTKRDLFEDRFWAMLLCAQQAVPRFKDNGSITFTSGTAAVRPPPGMGHLVGVAGTMISTTYGLAQDLAPKVRVNTIAPGLVDTEFWDGMPAAQRDAIFDHLKTKIPLRKAGSTDEIAESYLFAMKCTFLTGQVIYVDGGQLVA